MQLVASDMHGGVAMASYFEITKLPLPYFDKVTRTNKRSCESIHHVRRSAAEDIRSKDIQVAILRNLYNAGYAMLLLTCLSLPADGRQSKPLDLLRSPSLLPVDTRTIAGIDNSTIGRGRT